jgi:hypothetical protein
MSDTKVGADAQPATREKIRKAIHGNLGLRMALSIINPKAYDQNLNELSDVLADDVVRAIKGAK